MTNIQKLILLILIVFLSLIVGNNITFKFFKIDPEGIKLDELLNLVATISLGLYIPFAVTKGIENKRYVKNSLVEEINYSLTFIRGIKAKLATCYESGSIDSHDKFEINLMFDEADILIGNLELQVSNVDSVLCDSSKAAYISYWQFVTGPTLMNNAYLSIDEAFYKQSVLYHYKVEIEFKQMIQSIHKHT